MRNHTLTRKQSSAMREAAHGLERVHDDRGIVLILSLLVMLVLSVLGTAMLFLSGTEVNISRNSQVLIQSFFAAEAGVDTVLNQLPVTTAIPAQAVDPNNANVVFQTGPPGAPATPVTTLGPNPNPPAGFNLANYSFNMFQVSVSGTVILPPSSMQLQVGATIGTPLAGTSY